MSDAPSYIAPSSLTEALTTLKVDGYTFTFTNNSGTASKSDGSGTVGWDANYNVMSYASYGIVDTRVQTDRSGYVFYQGQVTSPSDMPVTGTATYAGTFYIQGGGNQNSYINATGTSNFSVDFLNHTLNGTLTATQNLDSNAQLPASSIYLQAALTGSAFSGTNPATGTTTTGKFFGPQAAELAGQFYNSNSTNSLGVPFIGAFGARKQ